MTCKHCRDTEYVLEYMLEKLMAENGMHMTDIPPDVFKLIPVENLRFCHCNIRVAIFPRRIEKFNCSECEDTTWRFSETAELAGYRWRKIRSLSQDEIKTLPCEYFERCPCGDDENSFKSPQKRKSLNEILESIKLKIPKLGFGLAGGIRL